MQTQTNPPYTMQNWNNTAGIAPVGGLVGGFKVGATQSPFQRPGLPASGGGGGFPGLPGLGGGGGAGGNMPFGGGGGFTTGPVGGGGGGFPGLPGGPGLTNVAATPATLQQQQQEFEQQRASLMGDVNTPDPYLQEQVENLRKRMGEDTTKRATEQAQSNIRDQMAGMLEGGEEEAARRGVGPGGAGAGQISEAGLRAGAKAASDIQMGQQKRLDELTLGGQGIMAAPGAQRMAKQAALSDFLKANPAATTEQIKLQAQKLGLEQWALPQQLGIQYMQAQQAMLNPIFQLLGGMF
jgi:hypothetical protein